MSLLIRALDVHTPEFVKKTALTQLFQFTAEAFQAAVPPIAGLASEACLAEYARFTQTHAELRLRDGHGVEAVEQRLHRNAVEMGQRYEKWLRLSTVADVMAAGRVLYRILATDFHGDAHGDIVIQRCYFSQFFSSDVCRLMSAMDAGLFAGLSNGGELTFTQRITEGRPCCRAHFSWEGFR